MYNILENNKFTNKKDSHAKLQALWLEAHYQVQPHNYIQSHLFAKCNHPVCLLNVTFCITILCQPPAVHNKILDNLDMHAKEEWLNLQRSATDMIVLMTGIV